MYVYYYYYYYYGVFAIPLAFLMPALVSYHLAVDPAGNLEYLQALQ